MCDGPVAWDGKKSVVYSENFAKGKSSNPAPGKKPRAFRIPSKRAEKGMTALSDGVTALTGGKEDASDGVG